MKRIALELTALIGLLLFSAIAIESQLSELAFAQTSVIITIKDDGSIRGTDRIQRNENIYTFAGNISGNIQIQKSNVVIDGAGFTLDGNNGTGIEISNEPAAHPHPSEFDVWNVTVKSLRVTNCHIGIRCDFGGNHTFYGDYISNDFVTENGTGIMSWNNLGIALWGSSGNNITHCTIGGSPAIYMHFACSGNIVTENNVVFGAHLAISGTETFDSNYWSDYSTRYPNVSEVDSSGVWDIPYAFADSTNFENRIFQDNHPLVSPLVIPIFLSVLPTLVPAHQSSVSPILPIVISIIAVTIAVVCIGLGLLVYLIKRK